MESEFDIISDSSNSFQYSFSELSGSVVEGVRSFEAFIKPVVEHLTITPGAPLGAPYFTAVAIGSGITGLAYTAYNAAVLYAAHGASRGAQDPVDIKTRLVDGVETGLVAPEVAEILRSIFSEEQTQNTGPALNQTFTENKTGAPEIEPLQKTFTVDYSSKIERSLAEGQYASALAYTYKQNIIYTGQEVTAPVMAQILDTTTFIMTQCSKASLICQSAKIENMINLAILAEAFSISLQK